MDTVRFGRALGLGARQAAKTVVRAVDAARAENPSKPTPPAAAVPGPASLAPASTSASAALGAVAPDIPERLRRASSQPRCATQTATQARGIQEGISRFKASAVEPVVRLSGVLWLEVTGVFFGIFALSTAIAIWRLRAEWRPALAHPAAHVSLLGAATIFVLFAYFSISSFVRARRRQRRRG